MVWVTGGALAIALLMIIGMLGYVLYMGIANFWPHEIVQVKTHNGDTYLGEITRYQRFRPSKANLMHLTDDQRAEVRAEVAKNDNYTWRKLIRTGNYELTGTRFHWVPKYDFQHVSYPEWAMVFERMEWGVFYGLPKAFLVDGDVVADTPESIWEIFKEQHKTVLQRRRASKKLETIDIGRMNLQQEEARLDFVLVQRAHEAGEATDDELEKARAVYDAELKKVRFRHASISREITELKTENTRYVILLDTASGQEKQLPLSEIVRTYPANRLSLLQKAGVFFSRWREFLLDDPREANTEGGVFPAIVGTVTMTLMMTIFVVPFGVLAALYLREYAKPGPLVSAVRIAINNLAGVPSIVFGVFGLGLFCYIFGGYMDELFYAARLPAPTFRKGGVLWASATLALLTLPVVIVATEEALAAVPGSMREGSYACGASKWQTIKRIVLPRALPGIMTGMILAMARGAGEVAPLMLTGAVKLAPDLPVDFSNWHGSLGPIPTGPIHLDRSFMHLGFHIYDVGFQSPDSEAARPMVFTTTLLLITIVVVLNVAAMILRAKLKKRFATGTF
jgi:phosphate transport system permease protein